MCRFPRQLEVLLADNVFPDLNGVGGNDTLIAIVGALLTVTLIVAVLALVISAVVWAVSSSTGHARTAVNGKTGVFVALGTAALAGAGVAWMNFLLHVGASF